MAELGFNGEYSIAGFYVKGVERFSLDCGGRFYKGKALRFRFSFFGSNRKSNAFQNPPKEFSALNSIDLNLTTMEDKAVTTPSEHAIKFYRLLAGYKRM
ncbi:MAG: hypothetical protein FWB80_07280 [Defluviitaleaceae bacterium]|nr:hypothetical protein [Defluviitaleaceae bacterium]